MSEHYDVTVQRKKTKDHPLLSTSDTITYRVAGNPKQARTKAGKRADARFGSGAWTIIDQRKLA